VTHFTSKRINIFVLSARISLFAICANKSILADKLIFYVGISSFAQISLSLQIALFILLFPRIKVICATEIKTLALLFYLEHSHSLNRDHKMLGIT
jgi:hypothetical protein